MFAAIVSFHFQLFSFYKIEIISGYLDKPKELYSLLLEASSKIQRMDSSMTDDRDSSVDCLLFS